MGNISIPEWGWVGLEGWRREVAGVMVGYEGRRGREGEGWGGLVGLGMRQRSNLSLVIS